MGMRTAGVGLVLTSMALAACGGDDGGGDDIGASAAPSSSTAPTTSAAPAPGARYVALGSSFAAGAGIEPQSPECGRSGRNYANLVAEELDLELVEASCGGAVTANITDTPQGANPPQIEAVTADTALITVTVGGNDLGYAATASACDDPASSCAVGEPLPEDRLSQLRGSLTSMIGALRERAPEAAIVLVTYPRLVTDEPCDQLTYAPEEVEVVRALGERLQEAFLDVADATGVLVADPYGVDGDHGPCAGDGDRWINGSTAGDGATHHPTSTGHAAMAELVLESLAG
jgi:lysophospholipase L1-like esterase